MICLFSVAACSKQLIVFIMCRSVCNETIVSLSTGACICVCFFFYSVVHLCLRKIPAYSRSMKTNLYPMRV